MSSKRKYKHAIKSIFLIVNLRTKKYNRGKTGRHAEMFLRELEDRDKQNKKQLNEYLDIIQSNTVSQ